MKAKKENKDLNQLPIEHYKKSNVKSKYFLFGLIIGYLPYCVHQGWLL